MTSTDIIADLMKELPPDVQLPAINYLLSLIVVDHVDQLNEELVSQLLTTIEPVDDLSVKAILLLQRRQESLTA